MLVRILPLVLQLPSLRAQALDRVTLPSIRTSRSWTNWKLRDRAPELMARSRVAQRVFVGAAAAADSDPGDAGPGHA